MMAQMGKVREELVRALRELNPRLAFNIVVLAEDSYIRLDRGWVMADKDGTEKASQFLERITPHGSSSPILALRVAFALAPEAILFMTDGDFANNDEVVREIQTLNREKRTKVHTVALTGGAGAELDFVNLLQRIAAENGGKFAQFR